MVAAANKLTSNDDQDDSSESKLRKLPNLCDPSKGQLFENFDKINDFEEFDNVYKDQILSRFRRDTQNRNRFTQQLNYFISRFYRLDGSITGIVPGKADE